MDYWKPIDTRPTDEENPFLVLLPGNDVCKNLAIQVTNFEGKMYADCMEGLIDWEDAITNATLWAFLPAIK